MSGKAFGSTKRDGALCVFPGCFRIINTQKYIEHFKAHLSKGESYTTSCRDEYERALLDPALLDLVDDGPLKALFVASMGRIAHVLDRIEQRLIAMSPPNSTEEQARPETASVVPVPAAPVVPVEPIAPPTTQPPARESQAPAAASASSDSDSPSSEEEELPPAKKPKTRKSQKKAPENATVGVRWSATRRIKVA